MRLRLDSDAALLTWQHLVEAEGNGNAGAMHKLVLNLMTVPGVEEPVVSIQSSLVRLAPSWRETGGAKYAWAALDGTAPILRGRVRNKRDGASWATVWDDRAAEVLRGASLTPLPDTNGDPTLNGALRTGYARQPRKHAIGRGVGTWFHECVAHHAQKALAPEARCVELVSTRASWPTQKTVAPRLHLAFDREEAELELRIFVVYASSAIRRRVRDALAHVLGEDAHEKDLSSIQDFCERLKVLDDDQPLRAGPVEVQFIKPPSASTWLLQRNARDRIEEWAASWLPSSGEEGVRAAAFMETNLEAATGKDDLADPKPVLRGILADRGIVTQFITPDSAPSSKPRRRKKTEKKKFEDFAAANAVGDLLRSSGFFLRPFPELGGGRGTIVVGIYGTRITKRITGRKTAYLTNLAAVELGSRDAWGFTDVNGWVPIDQATAWFLSNDQALSFDQAKQRVERAIGQLSVALDPQRTILLADAVGCRRFWPCLADKGSGTPEPWMRRDNTAVVRVRTAPSEVPRPAGVGAWDQGNKPALYTDFRPMALQDAQGRAPTFVVSGSAVMSQGMGARKTTRLRASATCLQEDWHSLGTTELLVMEPGSWEAEALIEQAAMLCRIAPTWDRTLRWPSPLHLARAVVRDHPHDYFTDEEAEDAEDSRQLRFDFGLNG